MKSIFRFGLDRANNELGQRLDEMDLLLKQEHIEVCKVMFTYNKLQLNIN